MFDGRGCAWQCGYGCELDLVEGVDRDVVMEHVPATDKFAEAQDWSSWCVIGGVGSAAS